jgi:hypothetical protein
MTNPVPSTYIVPTIRFDVTEEERELLSSTHSGIASHIDFKSLSLDDAFDKLKQPNDEVDETLFATQAHMLLVMRIFIGALRVGNTIEDCHACVIALLSHHPKDTMTVALDWAKPDMSELTGDHHDDPAPELDHQTKRLMKRVARVFKKTASMMPATISWSRIGMDLGLNPEDVAVAAGSSLDFDYIMGDITCNCSYCTNKRGA